MSAASARHFQTRESERAVRRSGARPEARKRSPDSVRAQARVERRRRERHFARRRRDLLEDVGVAFVLTLILITATAGLGVIALLELPLSAALVASVLIPRVRRRRRAALPGARPARRR
jgi:Flp pilus assembly protein TadB